MSGDRKEGSGRYKIDAHDLRLVAVSSDPRVRAQHAVFAIDTAMRANYDSLRAKIAANLSPVIIVQPDLQGGNYTLVHAGGRTTVYPVSPIFQLVKSVAHLPLGIYTILAPYLLDPDVGEWVEPLREFRSVAEAALAAIGKAGLPPKALQSSERLIGSAIDFMSGCIESGQFSERDFTRFSSSVHGEIVVNMSFAAQALVTGISRQLRIWEEELGPEGWKDLYTVILAIWTTQEQNQHYEVLKRIMYQETVEERLIVISVGEQEADMAAVALDNLARIVQDNVAAGLILPTDDELAATLAGQKDLLADAVDAIMVGHQQNTASLVAAACPHSAHRRTTGSRTPAATPSSRACLTKAPGAGGGCL
jgi:hypothetical protein